MPDAWHGAQHSSYVCSKPQPHMLPAAGTRSKRVTTVLLPKPLPEGAIFCSVLRFDCLCFFGAFFRKLFFCSGVAFTS